MPGVLHQNTTSTHQEMPERPLHLPISRNFTPARKAPGPTPFLQWGRPDFLIVILPALLKLCPVLTFAIICTGAGSGRDVQGGIWVLLIKQGSHSGTTRGFPQVLKQPCWKPKGSPSLDHSVISNLGLVLIPLNCYSGEPQDEKKWAPDLSSPRPGRMKGNKDKTEDASTALDRGTIWVQMMESRSGRPGHPTNLLGSKVSYYKFFEGMWNFKGTLQPNSNYAKGYCVRDAYVDLFPLRRKSGWWTLSTLPKNRCAPRSKCGG